jgi:MFS family permease
MTRPTGSLRRVLHGPMRWYLLGSGISNAGTWMHTVAQSWLVLRLTGSTTTVGLAVAAQYLPVLLLSPIAGVVIDRFGARRVLSVAQGLMAIAPMLLAVSVLRHDVTVLEVDLVAIALGAGSAFESTARQAVVGDLVEERDLRPALSIVVATNSVARFGAPALAALIIATSGTGVCFLANGLSFVAAFACTRALPAPLSPRRGYTGSGIAAELKAGLRLAARNKQIGGPLLVVALVSTVAWNYPVVLPALATRTFHEGPQTYGWFASAMGLGAALGAAFSARRHELGLAILARRCMGLAGCLVVAAVAPDPVIEILALVAVGGAGSVLLVVASASLQLAAGPSLRGRVMGLWSVAFLGTTVVGSPVIGWLTQDAGARWALAAGAESAVAGAVIARVLRQPYPPISEAVEPIVTSAEMH